MASQEEKIFEESIVFSQDSQNRCLLKEDIWIYPWLDFL